MIKFLYSAEFFLKILGLLLLIPALLFPYIIKITNKTELFNKKAYITSPFFAKLISGAFYSIISMLMLIFALSIISIAYAVLNDKETVSIKNFIHSITSIIIKKIMYIILLFFTGVLISALILTFHIIAGWISTLKNGVITNIFFHIVSTALILLLFSPLKIFQESITKFSKYKIIHLTLKQKDKFFLLFNYVIILSITASLFVVMKFLIIAFFYELSSIVKISNILLPFIYLITVIIILKKTLDSYHLFDGVAGIVIVPENKLILYNIFGIKLFETAIKNFRIMVDDGYIILNEKKKLKLINKIDINFLQKWKVISHSSK